MNYRIEELSHYNKDSPNSLIATFGEINDLQNELAILHKEVEEHLINFMKEHKWDRYYDPTTKNTLVAEGNKVKIITPQSRKVLKTFMQR